MLKEHSQTICQMMLLQLPKIKNWKKHERARDAYNKKRTPSNKQKLAYRTPYKKLIIAAALALVKTHIHRRFPMKSKPTKQERVEESGETSAGEFIFVWDKKN